MFRIPLKNKRYEKKDEYKSLEEKIALYLDMNKKNFKKEEINDYIKIWSDLYDYVANASKNKITIYDLDIPKEKQDFFAKKYKEHKLKLVVMPEKCLIGGDYTDKGKYDANLKNMKKMTKTVYGINTENLNNIMDKMNIKDDVLDDYKFGNGTKKFLIAKTKNGSYFVSKKDLDEYKKSPFGFLAIINRKKEHDSNSNIDYMFLQKEKQNTNSYVSVWNNESWRIK